MTGETTLKLGNVDDLINVTMASPNLDLLQDPRLSHATNINPVRRKRSHAKQHQKLSITSHNPGPRFSYSLRILLSRDDSSNYGVEND